MPFPNNAAIGQQLLDVPFPAMVKSMGLAIAEAQFELDRVGLRMAQMMSGKYEVEIPDPEDPEKTITQQHEAYVTFDGQSGERLEFSDTVRIQKAARPARLVRGVKRSYYQVLREKLRWAER